MQRQTPPVSPVATPAPGPVLPAPVAAHWVALLDRSLSQPLRRSLGALDLLCEGSDRAALKVAVDEVHDLLCALDRVVDLAAAWAAPDADDDERLTLRGLLQAAWADVEPAARERRISVEFQASCARAAGVRVYGDGVQLGVALREALAAAVRARPAGGRLRVRQQQDGTRAQIVLLDCGAPPPGDDAGHVGFSLCAAVLGRHGGRLFCEPEPPAVNWVLEVPTGAPHRQPPVELLEGQRRLFERDLAILARRWQDRAAARNLLQAGG